MKTTNVITRVSIGRQYFFATAILFSFILILYHFQDLIGYQTVSLILLLIIFLLPLFSFERGPIILAAIISGFAWDYYFIPPHFTMHIAKTEDVVMLFMFFTVAVTNGILTSQLKLQKQIMIENERQIRSLYLLAKSLSGAKDINDVIALTVSHIFETFGDYSAFYFPFDDKKLLREVHPASNYKPDEMEWLAAESAFLEGKETGKTTGIISDADAVYFPLKRDNIVYSVIGVKVNQISTKDKDFLRDYIQEVSGFLIKHRNYSMP